MSEQHPTSASIAPADQRSAYNGIVSFRLDIGKYSLCLRNGEPESLWLTNKEGEGMQVWNQQFFDLLDRHFKENF